MSSATPETTARSFPAAARMRFFSSADDVEGKVIRLADDDDDDVDDEHPATLLELMERHSGPAAAEQLWYPRLRGETSGRFYSKAFPVTLLPESVRHAPGDEGRTCSACGRPSCRRIETRAENRRREFLAAAPTTRPDFWVDVACHNYPSLLREECREIGFDPESGRETDPRVFRVAVHVGDTLLAALERDGRFERDTCQSPHMRVSLNTVPPRFVSKAGRASLSAPPVERRVLLLTYDDNVTLKLPPRETYTVVENKCAICFTRPTIYAFDPCGHMCCSACVLFLADGRCHMCRGAIRNQIRLFY